jgi:hypothetical protein
MNALCVRCSWEQKRPTRRIGRRWSHRWKEFSRPRTFDWACRRTRLRLRGRSLRVVEAKQRDVGFLTREYQCPMKHRLLWLANCDSCRCWGRRVTSDGKQATESDSSVNGSGVSTERIGQQADAIVLLFMEDEAEKTVRRIQLESGSRASGQDLDRGAEELDLGPRSQRRLRGHGRDGSESIPTPARGTCCDRRR